MNTLSTLDNTAERRRVLSLALVFAAAILVSARVQADDLLPGHGITLSAPAVQVAGSDEQIGLPTEQTAVSARVTFDAAALTTQSGVALFRGRVLEAARKACSAAGAVADDYAPCVREAVFAVEPQVDAAILDAKSRASG